jgi:hypothetical protein
MPSGTRLRNLTVAATCAAAIGLAACGGDDDGSTGGAYGPGNEQASPARERFNDQVREVLIDQQQLTDSEADCAIEELEETIPDEELPEAESAAELPPEILRAAFDAGVACAGR